jgi:hypothetical protein
MYARVTTTQFSPYRLEEAIGVIRDHTVPAAQKQGGFKGYLLLVDRSTGKGITITIWEDEKDRDISGPESHYYREEIGRVVPMLTDAPSVEDLEIVIHV